MSRKKDVEHDDADVDLAPRVTPQQLTELFARGWRGPTPSTEAQASTILEKLRSTPVTET
ncbi:MAG TPA: hypothetical protein VLQ80_25365 [Candidatus Saccharimonadia bacterium]|nr:hypothetical protein [Candidatus Saccharimonadia bacterium]